MSRNFAGWTVLAILRDNEQASFRCVHGSIPLGTLSSLRFARWSTGAGSQPLSKLIDATPSGCCQPKPLIQKPIFSNTTRNHAHCSARRSKEARKKEVFMRHVVSCPRFGCSPRLRRLPVHPALDGLSSSIIRPVRPGLACSCSSLTSRDMQPCKIHPASASAFIGRGGASAPPRILGCR